MDTVEIALITTGIALSVAVIGAGLVASHNFGSSTLTLSTAALAGTALVFILQSYFELQPTTDIDHVSTNFTLDASGPSIRQWEYPNALMSRMSVEINASNWLKEHNPESFDADRDKVFSDFVVFSFVSFMLTTEFDWQLRRLEYSAGHFGTATTVQPISKNKECGTYTVEELHKKLKSAGNLFADAPIIAAAPNKLCLPPDTKLDISQRSITFENYFCRATWKLDEIFTLMSHTKPGAAGDMPMLNSGKPQFETRISGMSTEVIYLRFRAKSPEMPKYKAWINRIMADSHKCLSPKPRLNRLLSRA